MPASRPHDRTFAIIWLDASPATVAELEDATPPPIVVGRTFIRRHDMSAAITTAKNLLGRQRNAYGFVVAHVKDAA